MTKFSIKRVKRLIDEEKPVALSRYLRNFIVENKRSAAEVRLDEYAHSLIKKGHVEKADVLKKLTEIENVVSPTIAAY